MHAAKVIVLGESGDPELVTMRWGFAYESSPGRVEHMHARSETVDRLPTFAENFRERRCIIPVANFNEGEEVETFYTDGTPAKDKPWTRQWVIEPKDRKPIFIAGIWNDFDDGLGPVFVMITTPPNELIAKITDRMPAILEQTDFEIWLGQKDAPLADVKALLKTYDDKGNWTARPEDPTKQPPKRRKAKADKPQGDLF